MDVLCFSHGAVEAARSSPPYEGFGFVNASRKLSCFQTDPIAFFSLGISRHNVV